MSINPGSLAHLLSGKPTADHVKRVAARAFNIGILDLEGPSREQPLAAYRQITMAAVRHVCGFSYPIVGQAFGGRHHTTVMHAVRTVANKRTMREACDQLCDEARKRWAIDHGQPLPIPGQLDMAGVKG